MSGTAPFISGMEAWLPSTAPDASPFLGTNRGLVPVRLTQSRECEYVRVEDESDALALLVHQLAVGYYDVPSVAHLTEPRPGRSIDVESLAKAKAIADHIRAIVREGG